MPDDLRVIEADLDRPEHCAAVTEMLAAYALEPMGNSGPLPDGVLERLIPGLRALPTSVVFLAFDGARPVGFATCFIGFSTFAGKPLINIHDLAVIPSHRGRGLSRALLDAVIAKARSLDCARVTLEVLEGNTRARAVYHAAGFTHGKSGDPAGGPLFYTKHL
ncbi:MAG: GNAT family N-acetyltransferase [Phycisphaeraceae bacterium]|nr:GNAT family N-acetyltransferase [Phycisphaeraceae bacterium]